MADLKDGFDDGVAYERMMGAWSRAAGAVFLDWLALPRGLRCLDVGCGNGAFTELLVERCALAEAHGIDPSPAQLAFARARPAARMATFEPGDAMALPYAAGRFDAAVMALVISFVPDPGKAVGELARVVRPGGTVATYMWDLPGGGTPLEPIDAALRALQLPSSRTPNPGASHIDALRGLWRAAGLADVETRTIEVARAFADFEEFWSITVAGTLLKTAFKAFAAADVERLKARVRAQLKPEGDGRIAYTARANAVKGRVPD
jgi:ubiquinone/menaquinone biosynthesis C-methylase UbiE